MKLSEAKVLVTGGSSGIGFETAKLLQERGARIAICGRRKKRLIQANKELDVVAISADVGKEEDVKALIKSTVDQLDGLDVVINNAAYGYFSPLVNIDTDEFKKVISTNVIGPMLVAKYSAKHFISQNYGNIINISSTAGNRGFSGGSPYVATKFALNGMSQCWIHELRKHNIRVMQINPSEVLTNFAERAGVNQNESPNKLRAVDIAHTIISVLELNDRGFVPDVTIWATNPD